MSNVDQCGSRHYIKDVTSNEIRDSDLRRVASAVTSAPVPQMADSPFLKALGTPTIGTAPAQTGELAQRAVGQHCIQCKFDFHNL